MDGLMPIGRFARSVRLSVKALRYYDEEGLLSPTFVDPDTGYRYYRPEQSRDAVAISMLRRLDMPVAMIRTLLGEGGREGALMAHRRRLERVLAEKQAALDSVDRLLAADALFPYDVGAVTEPHRRMATLDFTATAERLESETTEAVRRLMSELGAAGLAPGDPVLCLLAEPDTQGNQGVTVAVTLLTGMAPPELGFRVQRVSGGVFAKTVHRGPYTQLGLAHAAVFAWARERGHQTEGPIREIYLNDPAEVSASELRTEVLLPIDPA